MRIVLCASEKDRGHGAPGFHDYPLWRERWSKLLSLADDVTVETADRWPTPDQWIHADVIAFYHDNPAWTREKASVVDEFLGRGGGLVFLHWSLNAYQDVDALAPRLGLAWGAGAKFRHGPEELRFHGHELTMGFQTTKFVDETYWNLTGNTDGITVIASAVEEGLSRPQVWVQTRGKGRVFVCIPGHFTWTFDDPFFRSLVLRGIAWTADEARDRFAELVTIGARIAD